ncbi:MAG: hypothetical protein J6D47_18670 [Peptostreptococcaceae bacterium]|nr:hypothetical protein [Peptostreptococcaceae bacterium]
MKIKNIIQIGVELVESEFPNMDEELLFDRVWTLISDKKEEYMKMSVEDKFDYLVDSLMELQMEDYISELERQTNAECR